MIQGADCFFGCIFPIQCQFMSYKNDAPLKVYDLFLGIAFIIQEV